MNFLIISVLTVLFFTTSVANAADDGATDMVSIKVEQIHANPGELSNRNYVSTGQPNEETLVLAKEAGFTTVIDFRAADEDRGFDEEREVVALGMTYVSIPVDGPADINFDKAADLQRILAETDGPVLLHCGTGNRAGAIYALRAKLNGASSEEALAQGKQAGLTRSEEAVRNRLAEQ
jgi:uncharacterized protein (TIGR01244 family)